MKKKILCNSCYCRYAPVVTFEGFSNFSSFACNSKDCILNKDDDPDNKSGLQHRLAQVLLYILLTMRGLIIRRDHICSDFNIINILPIEEDEDIFFEYQYTPEDEFQHVRFADVAVLDKDKNIKYIFEISRTSSTLEASRVDYENQWFEFNDINVIGFYFDTINFLYDTRKDICDCVETGRNIKIFVKQSCAGSGKTYNAVRLINSIEEPRLRNFNTYIFVSKMNSTIATINKEARKMLEEDHIIIDSEDNIDERKYYYKFKSREDDDTHKVFYLSTIDSLFSIISGRGNGRGSIDSFEQISNSIYNSPSIRSEIVIPTATIKLNEKTLIVIDESQDLEEFRLSAISGIIEKLECSFYLIGDKLQSILFIDNVFRKLLDINTTHMSMLDKNIYKNIKRWLYVLPPTSTIKRFKNPMSLEFLNENIDYSLYDLPQPDSISDNIVCEDPVDIQYFTMLKGETTQTALHTEQVIESIIRTMNNTITEYPDSHPRDFSFIFTSLSGNELSTTLEDNINRFWRDKGFSREERSMPLCFRHTSENGGRIDLNESMDTSRIMTIHASKGTTSRFVFLIDPSKATIKTLYCSDDTPDHLKFNSFLNVAYTRHSDKLFIFHNLVQYEFMIRLNAMKLWLNTNKEKYIFKLDGKEIHKTIRMFLLEDLFSSDEFVDTNIYERFDLMPLIEPSPDFKIMDKSYHDIKNAQALFRLFCNVGIKPPNPIVKTSLYYYNLLLSFVKQLSLVFVTSKDMRKINSFNKNKYEAFKLFYIRVNSNGFIPSTKLNDVEMRLASIGGKSNFYIYNVRDPEGLRLLNTILTKIKSLGTISEIATKLDYGEFAVMQFIFNYILTRQKKFSISKLLHINRVKHTLEFLKDTDEIINAGTESLFERYKELEIDRNHITKSTLKGLFEDPNTIFSLFRRVNNTEATLQIQDRSTNSLVSSIPIHYKQHALQERGATLLSTFIDDICSEKIHETNIISLDVPLVIYIKFNKQNIRYTKMQLYLFITFITSDLNIENSIATYKRFKHEKDPSIASAADILSYKKFIKDVRTTDLICYKFWLYYNVVDLCESLFMKIGYNTLDLILGDFENSYEYIDGLRKHKDRVLLYLVDL